ncbi:hypothetical protein N2152v2_003266 [Parachlorella kessleri]
MAQQRDPYFVVKEEVEDTLRGVQSKFSQWGNLPRTAAERRTLKLELEEECHSLEYMLQEIDKSVDAAERNPQRFKLSQQELSDRRKWVMSTRRQIDTLRSNLGAGAAIAAPSTAASKLAAAVQEENDHYIRSEGDRQQLLMQQQDQELDQLGDHVVRIGQLGKEMGQELHVQGQLLDELDTEIEGTSTRLQAAQRKVQYVLDKAGSKGQIAIMLFLIVVLVILVVLAIG